MKLALGAIAFVYLTQAQAACAFCLERSGSSSIRTLTNLNSYARQQQDYGSKNYLLHDFRTAEGEVVNPYKVLGVKRTAEIREIKQQYRNLSKMYHPDVVRHKEVLPGKCNNLSDVRDEWERVLLSYEILSDHRQRLKYDRHSTLSNIGYVVGWGVTNLAETVGKGIEEGKKMSKKVDHAMAEVSIHMKRMEVVTKQAFCLIDQTSNIIEKIVVPAIKNSRTAKITSRTVSSEKGLTIPATMKIVAVPPPPSGEYYSPFEACKIIFQHEAHPTMDKPKAMRTMLEHNYVPIKRTQLYNIFNKFKDGDITKDSNWRQGGKLTVPN